MVETTDDGDWLFSRHARLCSRYCGESERLMMAEIGECSRLMMMMEIVLMMDGILPRHAQ